MKKTTILSVVAVLCLNFSLTAQEIKPLKVGDKLPESFWQQEHSIYQNGKTTKQNLSAYKGKLLILDFWATWCSSCLKKMPYLDSLQQAETRNLNVVMVNTIKSGDQIKGISNRMQTIFKKGLQLPTIYADQTMMNNFPHHILPHYVFVDKTETIIAITNSAFLNNTTIKALLSLQN